MDLGLGGAEAWAGRQGFEEEVGVRVVRSFEGDCPHREGGTGEYGGQVFDFVVPRDLEVGTQVFVWGWFNREGEGNWNCAAVEILGVDGEKRGRAGGVQGFEVPFADRPLMLMADVGNGCETPRTTAEVRYPEPGPDVFRGDGVYPLELPVGNCRGR